MKILLAINLISIFALVIYTVISTNSAKWDAYDNMRNAKNIMYLITYLELIESKEMTKIETEKEKEKYFEFKKIFSGQFSDNDQIMLDQIETRVFQSN